MRGKRPELFHSQDAFTPAAVSNRAGQEFFVGMTSLQTCSFVLRAVRGTVTEALAALLNTLGAAAGLAWVTSPKLSSPNQHMGSLGFGTGQLLARRQDGGSASILVPVRKAALLLNSLHRDLVACWLCPPCEEMGSNAESHSSRKLSREGKGQLPLPIATTEHGCVQCLQNAKAEVRIL